MWLGMKKNYKRFLFLIPLGLFLIDYLLIVTEIIKPLDQLVFSFLNLIANDYLTAFFKTITHLGSFIGISIVIVLILFWRFKIGLVCLIASLVQQGINRGLKEIIQRPRPVISLINESGYSFPSGHAMAITCLYGLIIYYLWQSDLKYRKGLCVISALIIVIVLISRVYLGVHYFSDVLGGFLLSLSIVLYIGHIPSWQA